MDLKPTFAFKINFNVLKPKELIKFGEFLWHVSRDRVLCLTFGNLILKNYTL